MRQFLALTLSAGLASYTAAHSWIECSNYLINNGSDAEYYNKANCVGYPRCSTLRNGVFGNEGSLNYQSVNSNSCQCDRAAANAYTKDMPAARYTPGQKVCLAYPAKNHVAAPCTNQYIPDNGMTIYRSERNSDEDYPLQQWPVSYPNLNGAHQQGVIDYKGFQNCPKFCENMDKSLCTVCFNLEPDLAPGRYTFHWEWLFNVGQARYISCWEAVVGATTDPAPAPAPAPAPGPGPAPAPAPAPAAPGTAPAPQQPAPAPAPASAPDTPTISDELYCD